MYIRAGGDTTGNKSDFDAHKILNKLTIAEKIQDHFSLFFSIATLHPPRTHATPPAHCCSALLPRRNALCVRWDYYIYSG